MISLVIAVEEKKPQSRPASQQQNRKRPNTGGGNYRGGPKPLLSSPSGRGGYGRGRNIYLYIPLYSQSNCYWYLLKVLSEWPTMPEMFVAKIWICDLPPMCDRVSWKVALWTVADSKSQNKLPQLSIEVMQVGNSIVKLLDVLHRYFIHLEYMADIVNLILFICAPFQGFWEDAVYNVVRYLVIWTYIK